MNTDAPATADPGGRETFSLFLGGPLYQIFRRARLTDDVLALARRRVVVISLLAWLPLLLLATAEGLAFGGVAVPFALDAEVHVRFLVVVPLLVAAELLVHDRMRRVPEMFLERHLIADDDMTRFRAAIASAYRLRNSVFAEVVIIAFVYVVGVLVVWRQYLAIDSATWYAAPAEQGATLTFAGLWFCFVSLPFFQFLLIRWYFRIFIWARFLWHVSRIPLKLIPTHPDRVGGLGFLSAAVQGFFVLAAAHGAMLSAYLANRVLHLGAPLNSFLFEVGGFVVFVQILALAPLLVFASQLALAKRIGAREYGSLAERYVRAFDTKWLRGGAAPGEEFLGSADIQSLADLNNSLDVVKGMRFVPVMKADILRLAAVTLAPVAPLLLTIMPLEELLRRLLGILF